MRTVSFIQYKGGSGKTTAAALLCRVLSAAGYRVLAVDLDRYQYHLSTLLGCSTSPELCGPRSSTAYASGVLSHLVQKTVNAMLDCITLCGSLCDPESLDALQLSKRFAFFNFRARYDYILIDTPPGFGTVHELAIHASDDIILPTDLSPISLSVVQRFCADFDRRPGLSATRCHVLRHFLVPSKISPHAKAEVHNEIKSKLSAHSLGADESVRSATTECADFLKLPLPRHIVSQLVHIATDILHADHTVVESGAVHLCEKDYAKSMEENTALVFDGLLKVPPTMTFSTDVSIAAS